jgi:IPT/TIG domain
MSTLGLMLHMSRSAPNRAVPPPLAPPAPVLTALAPNHMEVDQVMRVLVNGSGFTPQSSVHFAGAEQSTEFVSDAQLAFEAEAEEPGEYPVTVVTPPGPGGGGGESNAVIFEVHEPEPEGEPEPTISSLEPSSTEGPASSAPNRRR